ncbi:hypothetical protein Tco_1004886 [Tanacetum coccineum]|uniref:Reverse transcriptase domain-containing protein n=1 Tax=Tanacetum coccineum TaxID=301880 RepID=A0ABQ5FEL0_9ASTR
MRRRFEEDPTEAIHLVVGSPPGSPPISPPPLLESSSNSEFTTPTEIATTHTGVDRIMRRMDAFDVDLGFIEQDATRVSDDVLALQGDWARDRDENKRLKRRLDELESYRTLPQVGLSTKGYGKNLSLIGLDEDVMGSTMEIEPNPRRSWWSMRNDGRNRWEMLEEAGGGVGAGNAGGIVAPEGRGCSYKTFLNCKPYSFNGTKGVVGLSRWFEKWSQSFNQ